MLLAVCFCFFIASSCKNNGGGDVQPPEPIPPSSTPPAEIPPPIPQPPEPEPPGAEIEPEVDVINACKEPGRSSRDVTTLPAARSDTSKEKIVGGRPTTTVKWPWAVAISELLADNSLRQFCGGSVVGDRWVLTAAHCQVRSSDIIIIGRSDLTTNEGNVFNVKRVIEHCNFDRDTFDSDFSLVELEPQSGVSLQPVALVDRGEPSAQPGTDATIVGWGRLQPGGSTSNTLQEVTVPIKSNAQCEQSYPNAITDNMLCAGREEGGQDSCQGDSGGPLMVKDSDGEWKQAGIVSWGEGCAEPDKFGVYSRVGRFLPWINDTMNGE